MLSLAHVLVPMDASQIVEELRLASTIARAIEHHEGDLGALLVCAEALETQNEAAFSASIERWPALRDGAIARLGIEAARWTVLHGTMASGCQH
jgi:EAL and modified HD-GYP domain-containing signal transduction protein